VSHNPEVAHRLAAAGLPVFACGFDKQPQPGCRWTKLASTYRNCVDGMWKRFGMDSMPAIHLGRCGLVVLDLDRHHEDQDGVAAFGALEAEYGLVPDCPVVETPSGGFHLFFRQAAGKSLGNRTGALPAGIDIRGIGGYVIGVGSVRDDGCYYGAVAGTPDLCEAFAAGSIAEIPAWLVELIEAGQYAPQPNGHHEHERCPLSGVGDGNRRRAYALAALDRITRDLAATPCGRNAALNDAAFTLGGFAWLGISEAEVWDALSWACMVNGWIAKDGMHAFRATFNSGWRRGNQRPLPGPRDAPASDIKIDIKPKGDAMPNDLTK
jgi:hypothetical protein